METNICTEWKKIIFTDALIECAMIAKTQSFMVQFLGRVTLKLLTKQVFFLLLAFISLIVFTTPCLLFWYQRQETALSEVG